MDLQHLRALLSQQENARLEFKQAWYKLNDPDKETQKRQRGELVRDILSLANGNASVVGDTAYLIIGVADTRNNDGTRDLFDIQDPLITPVDLLNKVNQYSDPPIDALTSHAIHLDRKRLIIIALPPSPHLHETTKKLDAVATYDKHTVFIRHNERIDTASAKERAAIMKLKQLHFEYTLRPKPRIFGAGVGALTGGVSASAALYKEPVARRVGAGIAGGIMGSICGALLGDTYQEVMMVKPDWDRATPREKVMMAGVYTATVGAVGLLHDIDLTGKND